MPDPDEESVQGAVRLVQLRRVSKVVDDTVSSFPTSWTPLALLLDDAPQRRLVPLVPIRLGPNCGVFSGPAIRGLHNRRRPKEVRARAVHLRCRPQAYYCVYA